MSDNKENVLNKQDTSETPATLTGASSQDAGDIKAKVKSPLKDLPSPETDEPQALEKKHEKDTASVKSTSTDTRGPIEEFKRATDVTIKMVKEKLETSKHEDDSTKVLKEAEEQAPEPKEEKTTHESKTATSDVVYPISIASSTDTAEDASDNVVKLIKQDHNKARALYAAYKATDDRSVQSVLVKELVKCLVAHDECEQLLVYPLFICKVQGNQECGEMYKKNMDQHQEHRELLYQLKTMNIYKEYEKFDAKLKKVMDFVDHHFKEEEEQFLPLLEKYIDQKELCYVGKSFRIHKSLCLTRPHPQAPQSGFPAAVINMMIKPFDATLDFLEGQT